MIPGMDMQPTPLAGLGQVVPPAPARHESTPGVVETSKRITEARCAKGLPIFCGLTPPGNGASALLFM